MGTKTLEVDAEINMFDHLGVNLQLQSNVVLQFGLKDDLSQEKRKECFHQICHHFLLFSCLRGFSVPLSRQGSELTFIFSEEKSYQGIHFREQQFAAFFFHFLAHKRRKCSISQSRCTLVTSQSPNSFADSSKSFTSRNFLLLLGKFHQHLLGGYCV